MLSWECEPCCLRLFEIGAFKNPFLAVWPRPWYMIDEYVCITSFLVSRITRIHSLLLWRKVFVQPRIFKQLRGCTSLFWIPLYHPSGELQKLVLFLTANTRDGILKVEIVRHQVRLLQITYSHELECQLYFSQEDWTNHSTYKTMPSSDPKKAWLGVAAPVVWWAERGADFRYTRSRFSHRLD